VPVPRIRDVDRLKGAWRRLSSLTGTQTLPGAAPSVDSGRRPSPRSAWPALAFQKVPRPPGGADGSS